MLCRPCHSLALAYLLQEVVYIHALIDIEEKCDPLPNPHILYAHSLEFTGRIQIGLILSGLESSVRINNEAATTTSILLIFTGLCIVIIIIVFIIILLLHNGLLIDLFDQGD